VADSAGQYGIYEFIGQQRLNSASYYGRVRCNKVWMASGDCRCRRFSGHWRSGVVCGETGSAACKKRQSSYGAEKVVKRGIG